MVNNPPANAGESETESVSLAVVSDSLQPYRL